MAFAVKPGRNTSDKNQRRNIVAPHSICSDEQQGSGINLKSSRSRAVDRRSISVVFNRQTPVHLFLTSHNSDCKQERENKSFLH